MSRYDGRSGDPTSYRDRRSDVGYSDGGLSSYGRSYKFSSAKETEGVADLDGLVPFEKNFYKESSSVASMSEAEVDEYRRRREITVESRDFPRPVRDFRDVGFPGRSKRLSNWYTVFL